VFFLRKRVIPKIGIKKNASISKCIKTNASSMKQDFQESDRASFFISKKESDLAPFF